ncbi:MAG TPA: vWA domain-containing protein [Polyangiales bacterium]|nr:vWA domain-containing protein [Polyangiales bacterium]
MLSRKQLLPGLVCSLAFALLALSCSSSGDTMSGARGGTAARSGGFAGGSVPGTVVGAGAAGTPLAMGNPAFPDLGRPGQLPPVMATSTGGSSCLDAVVLFVVDGSGSMCDTFGGATRWTALRSALLDPMNGLIVRLEGEAQFGLMIYDGSIDLTASGMATMTSPNPACAGLGGLGNMQCPRYSRVAPMFANSKAIGQAFPQKEPGGSTPTHKAMNDAVTQMMMSAAGKDPASSPHFIILATDGQPNDICMGGLGGDGSAQKAEVIAAADRAAAAGIRTFVISLAGNDAGLEAHLAEVAKHGDPLNPTAHTFSPMTPQDLQMALRAVLSSALGCVI